MAMFNVEFAQATLDNQPRFVIWENRAGAMEFCDIEGARLGAWGHELDLGREVSE
jgi:hypothetical protein